MLGSVWGEADALIVTETSSEHGSWRIFIQITGEPDSFVVIHAQFPLCIPAGSREKLSKWLTRLNGGAEVPDGAILL